MGENWQILAAGVQEAMQDCRTIAWDDAHEAQVRLSEVVNSNLLAIRNEHMRWAWETGLLPAEESGLGENIASFLEAGQQPSMWWTSILYERHPKISPNLFIIYKLRALELLFTREKPDTVCLSGGDADLAKSIGQLCAAWNIAFSHKNPAKSKADKNLLRRVYRFVPAPVRALARFAHWWWTVRRHLPLARKLTPLAPCKAGGDKNLAATIVSYFPNIDLNAAVGGHFRSRYWESLHHALNREAKHERPEGSHFVRWLFIRFPSPQLDFARCRKLCNLFAASGKDGLSFNYLEEFLGWKDMGRAVARWLKICAQSFRLRNRFVRLAHFENSRLNFWEWLKWDYAESFRGWRCLERCLQNCAFKNYFRLAGKQRWTLFPLENCPWERMATFQAREIDGNGPIFGAQHSMVRPSDFRYFDAPATFMAEPFKRLQPDKIGGNGCSSLMQWRDNDMPESRMMQLEALRYLYLAADRVKPAFCESIAGGDGEPLEPAARKGHLLVLTSFFDDETTAHLDLLRKCMEVGALKGWQISIKPHPVLSVRPWFMSLPVKLRERIMLLDAPLASLLQSWQFVWASNSTTAALEAALKGLPLMVMAPMNDFDLCPIQNVAGLCRTATVQDVIAALQKPQPIVLPNDYLDINPALGSWKKLLGLVS